MPVPKFNRKKLLHNHGKSNALLTQKDFSIRYIAYIGIQLQGFYENNDLFNSKTSVIIFAAAAGV